MEALIKMNNKLTLKVEGSDQLELFQNLAQHGEVFGIQKCGCCGSDDFRYVVRQVEDTKKKGKFYKYYELHCQKQGCRARFSFGQLNEGGALFPKRKGENGEYLDHDGWVKYQKPAEGSTVTPEGK
jgi:hypothetical protein